MHINWRDNSSVAANVLNKEVCLRNRERERERERDIHGNIPNSILSEALRFSMLMSKCRRLALMPRGMLDRQTYTHKHITRQSLTWKKRERIREQWYFQWKIFNVKEFHNKVSILVQCIHMTHLHFITRPSLGATSSVAPRPSDPCLQFPQNKTVIETSNLVETQQWTRVTRE